MASKTTTNQVLKADIRTIAQARKVLAIASRFIAAGHEAADDASGFFKVDYVTAAKSSLNEAARWVREAQALLAGSDDAPLTVHQQDKVFISYTHAVRTMKLVDAVVNDGSSWVDDLQTGAKQTLGAVANAAGGVVAAAGNLAGTAAGGILGGFFSNLGFGAVGLVLVVGGVLYIKNKARI